MRDLASPSLPARLNSAWSTGCTWWSRPSPPSGSAATSWKKLNRALEEKVKERTAELYAANQELTERHQEAGAGLSGAGQGAGPAHPIGEVGVPGTPCAGVAHELNNPISFIHSNLDFIAEYVERLKGIIEAYETTDLPDGPARRRVEELKKRARLDFILPSLDELIASCQQGTERVKKIVMDLRTFSRTDEVGPMKVDLHEGIETTLNLLTKEYKDRIAVHRDYGDLPQGGVLPRAAEPGVHEPITERGPGHLWQRGRLDQDLLPKGQR